MSDEPKAPNTPAASRSGLRPDTRLVEAGRRDEWLQGLVNVPVSRTSTVLFDNVASMNASYPPKVERTDDISASARIPDIVSGVVMNYSFIQVGFCLVFFSTFIIFTIALKSYFKFCLTACSSFRNTRGSSSFVLC